MCAAGTDAKNSKSPSLYIALISVHGLIRGEDLELGRDADTGGQTKYVVDLARALSIDPRVGQVVLFTRRIIDDQVDDDYAIEVEPLAGVNDKARIVRISCGPDNYLPKESLWDYLDEFADNLYTYFKNQPSMPDVLHSHYADAGYVGVRVSHTTEVPLVHTGHSLGRDKRERLMAAGISTSDLEARYQLGRRIEAEEEVLANAKVVITSTQNEIDEQYGAYDFFQPLRMRVIPPGTNLDQFHPPELGESPTGITDSIRRFLDDPHKPIILALSRPDPRKNIATLVKAYGESLELQALANLVIVAGNRDDIRKMDEGAQDVLSDILVLMDYYDLYGKLAIPKKHLPDEVPAIYRLAASQRGIFVNIALIEPFGLTLLESAASGLPFVATENGGPVDIVKNCKSGILCDPLNVDQIADALKKLLTEGETWKQYSKYGLKNVQRKYSWQAHSKAYIDTIHPIIEQHEEPSVSPSIVRASRHTKRLIISDLDKTLISDTQGLNEFIRLLKDNRKKTAFGIATARRLDLVLPILKKYSIPKPDILISSLGSVIHYSPSLNFSSDWANHVDHDWNPKAIKRILANCKGLELQPDENQSRFKISYDYTAQTEGALGYDEIIALLRQEDQSVNVFLSSGQNMDITPSRVSKGSALRYVAHIWDIPLENILVAGGAGADRDMLNGSTLSVVVNNRASEELGETQNDTIYFASKPNALGILEAIDHYKFLER